MRPTKPIIPQDETRIPVNNEIITIYIQRYILKFIPIVTATSSPINMIFNFLACNKKKILQIAVHNNGTTKLLHLAVASEPIVQNFIDCIPSALLATEIIKLEKAVQRALTTVPDKINFVEEARPPKLDNVNTIIVAIIAPINDQNATPETEKTCKDPTPHIMEKVAPSEAPDETPKI